MEFRLGENVLFLRGGEAVLVPPGLPHATANEKLLSEPAHLYWMVLSPKNFLGLPASVTHSLFRQLAGLSGKILRPRSEIKSIFEELLESLSKKSPTNQSEIIAHALRISLAFSRGTISSTPKKNALLLQKIQSLLLADSGEKAGAFNPTGSLGSIGAIAAKLNLQARTLARRFKREQGMDLKDFLLRTKIEAAKKSLSETSTPLTDIAHSLGFSSSAHFSTAFRRLTGVSPLSFRRNSTIL